MTRARVLIVEDDEDIRVDLAHMLANRGYATSTARNGVEALDELRGSSPPSLIILDLMMPTMDGWQLRDALRADPALTAIPVVLVSGAGDLAAAAEAVGAVAYLAKPFRIASLVDLVRRYCSR